MYFSNFNADHLQVTQEEDNVIVIYSPDKVIELQTT